MKTTFNLFNKVLMCLAILIIVFSHSKKQALAATVTWTGGSSTWSTGSNWSGGSAPGPGDDAVINSNVTVSINATTTINSLTLGNASGTTSPTLNFTYDAIAGTPLIIDDGDLTVYSGANITHADATSGSTIVGRININVQTGNTTIEGSVNVDYKGYLGSSTSNTNGDGPGGGQYGYSGGNGGGYGGYGGNADTNSPGASYGSAIAPTYLGSAGGTQNNSCCGRRSGDGGGAIKIVTAGTLTINGVITADGQAGSVAGGYAGGSGSGGSVYLIAGSIAGSGSITATGGNKSSTYDGGGGGGRVALHYTSTYSYSGTISVAKGTSYYGGENGTAIVYDDDSYEFTIPTGSYGTIYASDISELTAISDLTINGTVTFQPQSATQLEIAPTGTTTIGTGITLTLKSSYTTNSNGRGVYFNLSGDVTIPATTTITANSNGYLGGNTNNEYGEGPGGGQAITGDDGGGGSYGGVGGTSSNNEHGGSTYGSLTQPVDLGSGGGAGNNTYGGRYGGAGGGAIRISTDGNLTVSGTITANGQAGIGSANTGGGGSGGSIWISAKSLLGSGTITAKGGAYGPNYSGGGGGGRVSLDGACFNNWQGTSLTAASMTTGGIGYGASGTGANGTVNTTEPKSIRDSSTNDYGASSCNLPASTWVRGRIGGGLELNGVDEYADIGAGPTAVRTVSFWVKPATTTEYFTNMTSTSTYIWANAGTVTATGFTSPTIYVNGVQTSTIVANEWQYITVTTSTAVNASNFDIGRTADTNYLQGMVDEFKTYNYVRNQEQIIRDMNADHPVPGSPVGSPVLHLKFDEGYLNSCSGGSNDACDSSPQGNDGAFAGTAAYTDYGKYGRAVSLDGDSDYVDTGSPTSLDSLTSITVSLWVNPDALDNQLVNYPISKGPGSATSGDGWGFGINGTYTAGCSASGDNVLFLYTSNSLVCTTSEIPTNTWTHIIFTHNGGVTRIYINGKLAVSASQTLNTDSAQNLNIGRRSDGFWYWDGKIDEVKIYNFAMTADQVKMEYNNGKSAIFGANTDSSGNPGDFSAKQDYCPPGTGSCTAPVGEWNFNERSGTSAYDSAGNTSAGTISGATWTLPRNCRRIDSCLSFDGVNDYVASANTTVYQNFTLQAWVKPQTTALDYQAVLSKSSYCAVTTNDFPVTMYINPAGTTATIYVDSGNDWNYDLSVTSDAFTNNVWHHIAGTYDGSTLTIWVDGKGKSTTGNVTLSSNSQPWTVGRAAQEYACGDGKTPFKGLIDDVKIYNYARTRAQIAWDYNQGAPVGWWKLDECQGTTAYDSGSGGNEGTITIGATGTYTTAGSCSSDTSTEAWNAGTTGKRNSAIGIDGVNDKVTISSSSTLSPSSISIFMWVYPNTDQATEGGYGQFISKYIDYGASPDDYVWRISRVNPDNTMIVGVTNSGGTPTSLTPSTLIPTGEWSYVGFTYTGSTLTAYVNGVAVASTTSAVTMDTADAPIYIGSTYYNGVEYYDFNGLIDDVKIWNYALTPAQVKTEYNGGAVTFR